MIISPKDEQQEQAGPTDAFGNTSPINDNDVPFKPQTGTPKSNNPLLAAVQKAATPTEEEAAAAQDVEKYNVTQTDLLANAGSKLLGMLGKASAQYSGVPTQGATETYDAATGVADTLLKGKQTLQQQAQKRLAQLTGQREAAQKSALVGLQSEREVQGMEQQAALAPSQLESAVLSNKLKQQDFEANQLKQQLAGATKAQKDDPNSSYSRAAQKLAEKLKIPGITANMSATQIEPMLPLGEKIYAVDTAAEAKRQAYEDRQADAEAKRLEREEKLKYDRAEKANKVVVQNRADYNKEPLVKDFNKNTMSLAAVERAIDSPNPVKDLGAVYDMMRGFDPTSTVREGEFKLGQNAMGLVGTLKNTIDSAIGSQRLQPEQREQIRQSLQGIRETMKSEIEKLNQQHISAVQAHPARPDITGHLIDPVTGKVGLKKEGSGSQGNVVQSQGTSAPHGNFVEQDGKRYKWDGSNYVEVR